MRVRHTLAVVALFPTLLFPFTHATASHAANPVVDRALLQQLIATRRDLVAYIATNDVQRGQAFTLAALMAADATLSSDAASLQRAIVRLSWHPTHRRATPHHAAAPASPLLAVAGPGALWSPGARPVTPQTLAWSLDPPPAARALRDPIARPLAASLAALTSWADLLPQASNRATAEAPAVSAHHATPRAIAPDADPRYVAQAYGRADVDGGDGVQPLAAANPTVAAALATPLPTPTARPRTAHAVHMRKKTAPQPTLAVLTARWHSVAAALAQVRALETWARGTAPTASITPQDLITSPQVLHARLDRWSALPDVDPSTIAAIQPFLSSDVAVPAPASGATVAVSSSIAATSTTGMTGTLTDSTALSATIAAAGDTPIITSSITDTLSGAPAQAITSAVSITSSAAVTADVADTATATGTATPDLSATPAATVSALYATPTPTPSPQGVDSSGIAAAITGTAGLTATTAISSVLPVTAPAALDLTDEGGTIALTATTALSASAPLTLVVTLPVTAEQQLVPPEFLSKRGALESVLRQGQALYASLKQSQAAVLADYQARLHVTAMRNAGIEQAWYRHYNAYQAYLSAYAAYVKRKAAYDAYARRLHQAALAHAAWVQRKEAYDRYQQELAAYNRALAARGLTPVPTVSTIATPAPSVAAPITSTAVATWAPETPAASPIAPTPSISAVAGETPLAATPVATSVAETPAPSLATTAVVATPVPSPSFFDGAETPVPATPDTPVPSPILGTGPLMVTDAASASGAVPADAAPLPPRPAPVPPPGPEPRFTERAPAWPGSSPHYITPAGPEPQGSPLPDPPPSIPPWDNDTPTLPPSLVSYGGIAMGVGAAGRRETTTAALLADGALDGVGSYQDPIKGVITTYWGGSTPFQSFHPGLDIAAAEGTPVHAAARGIVVWAGLAVPGQPHDSYGNCVIIRHNDHFSTLYGHMLLDPPLQVQVGQIVQQGQVIGYEGMTGWATGPHVHFEIRDDNVQVNPLLLIPNPQD